MRVLHSKHQKLILQCYPPGKGVDKKPNPSELSYLLYYASTRRVKLEKVIEFLKRKTKADVRSRKSGNLSVTLAIVSALITKCDDNLNAFAPQVCAILSLILPLKELPLCKALTATYCVFCAKLDNGLFAGDKEFVDAFEVLTSDLVHLAESQSSLEATNRREWEMISLLTCRHVFSCLGYNALLSSKFIPRTVGILASTVSRCFTTESLTSRLKTALNVEQGSGERLLTRITTVKSLAPPAAFSGENFDVESLSDADLGEEALCGLRTLFHTSISHQINEATKSVVEYDFANEKANAASVWGTTFLQVCASYIPVQLRFETLLTLLDTLSNIANHATETKTGFPHMRHYAKYIMSLVSSGFNMIGLSISDILLQFLTLKTNLYLRLSAILSPDEVSELSVIYSHCICNLSSHIYYFDQVSDSIECILMQVDNVLVSVEETQANKTYYLVLDLLEIIYNIMELLSANRSAITWNHATLENWDVSFPLMTFRASYPRFASMVTRPIIVHIQSKYLEVVQNFLDRELFSKSSRPGRGSGEGLTRYLEPNYKNYIADRENTLNTLLQHCGDYFGEDVFDTGVARSMSKILAVIAGVAGVNFAHNFLSFFAQWQLTKHSTSSASIAKDACAYLLLTTSITCLNDNYQDILGEDISESSLSYAIFQDVKERETQLWKLGAHSHPFVEKHGAALTNHVHVGLIEDFFGHTPLKQWLRSPNSILVEFENGDNHSLANGGIQEGQTASTDDNSLGSVVPFSGSKLGLGTANDISSIYSGLNNGHTNGHSNGKLLDHLTPDTSQLTQATLHTHKTPRRSSGGITGVNDVHVPRVEDLKNSVAGTESSSSFTFQGASPTRSVFQRKHRPRNVRSILAELRSDDDRHVVV